MSNSKGIAEVQSRRMSDDQRVTGLSYPGEIKTTLTCKLMEMISFQTTLSLQRAITLTLIVMIVKVTTVVMIVMSSS